MLALRLRDLSAIRAAAAWLSGRPQLGQDVFARGAPEDHTEIDRSRLALDLGSLVRAYLGAARRGTRSTPLSAPAADPVDACRTRCTGSAPCSDPCRTGRAWSASCRIICGGPTERRAALASTLLAGLEMARGGAVRLRQEHDSARSWCAAAVRE